MAAPRVSTTPSHDEIASLAYEFYLQRGASDGNDLEDWLRAERESLRRSEERPTWPRSAKTQAV